MARRIESHWIAGPAGRLEALLEEPEQGEPRLAALVCHPHPRHGGTMHNKVVYRMARGLRRAGAVTLRFNFRGVNLSEGAFDDGVGEVSDAGAAVAWLQQRYPQAPAVLAGFSFGGRVILKLGALVPDAALLIAAGFPARLPDAAAYLPGEVPRLFLHSTNDEYGPREAMESFFEKLEGRKKMVWLDAEDHFFTGGLDRLEDEAANCWPLPASGDAAGGWLAH